jgi:hypothetical protein
MTTDPYTYAHITSTGPMYVGKIYTAKDTDCWGEVLYDHDNLLYFAFDYDDREGIDNAMMCMCDPSLVAEVHRYHNLMKKVKGLHEKMKCIEGELFTTNNCRTACVCRLQATNTKACIEVERDKDADIRVVIPWEYMQDHLGVTMMV